MKKWLCALMITAIFPTLALATQCKCTVTQATPVNVIFQITEGGDYCQTFNGKGVELDLNKTSVTSCPQGALNCKANIFSQALTFENCSRWVGP